MDCVKNQNINKIKKAKTEWLLSERKKERKKSNKMKSSDNFPTRKRILERVCFLSLILKRR